MYGKMIYPVKANSVWRAGPHTFICGDVLDLWKAGALVKEPEELLRLKHITGFSKLFANVKYKQAWQSKRQVLLEKQYGREHTNGDATPA